MNAVNSCWCIKLLSEMMQPLQRERTLLTFGVLSKFTRGVSSSSLSQSNPLSPSSKGCFCFRFGACTIIARSSFH